MAHIEAQQTNGSVTTFVRGRVYRPTWKKPTQTLSDRTRAAAKQRRRVCLLSAYQAKQLENWNQSQPCYGEGCRHAHFTRDESRCSYHDVTWTVQLKTVQAMCPQQATHSPRIASTLPLHRPF